MNVMTDQSKTAIAEMDHEAYDFLTAVRACAHRCLSDAGFSVPSSYATERLTALLVELCGEARDRKS